ncbi:MAG: F0F1 ATP synthase subunit delta [Patescibacteria group bacterium]|nr:F0F1 ATP synthase subunit delta [Patescibacteria group bacterium]MDE2437913.1 F0F1 ATP synthase subunit delta [Patescibacteria group bacterium]
MKYTVREYAHALVELAEDKKQSEMNALLHGFLSFVYRNGDMARLGRIVQEVSRQYYRSRGLHPLEIESASPLTDAVRNAIRSSVFQGILIKESLREELHGGVTILIDHEILIDASFEYQLTRMFTH